MLNMKLIINTDKQYWIKQNGVHIISLPQNTSVNEYYVIPEPENLNTFENEDGSTRIVCEAKEIAVRKAYHKKSNNTISYKPQTFEKAELLIIEK